MTAQRRGLFLLLGIIVFLLCLPWIARSDGENSVGTYKDSTGRFILQKWTWAANSAGNYNSGASVYVTGYLVGFRTYPVSGVTAPETGYDVTLTDSTGADVLDNLGMNLSTAAGSTAFRTPLTYDGTYRVLHNEPLGLHIRQSTATGTSPMGIVELFVKE